MITFTAGNSHKSQDTPSQYQSLLTLPQSGNASRRPARAHSIASDSLSISRANSSSNELIGHGKKRNHISRHESLLCKENHRNDTHSRGDLYEPLNSGRSTPSRLEEMSDCDIKINLKEAHSNLELGSNHEKNLNNHTGFGKETLEDYNNHNGGKFASSNNSCSCCMRVAINVAGQIYETQMKTLSQFPDSLLGHPEKRMQYFDPIRNQYFFDRNRRSFDAILHYYQTGGRLRRPLDVPIDIFADEIKFYQLGTDAMKKFKEMEGYEFNDMDLTGSNGAGFNVNSNLASHRLQRRVWMLFERPDSGNAAKVVVTISIVAILLSVISFCLETMPSLQKAWKDAAIERQLQIMRNNRQYIIISDSNNNTNLTHNATLPCLDIEPPCNVTNRIIPQFTRNPFWVIETICIVWFIIELTCRFLSSPNKKRFFCSAMNLIDLIAIIPYFLTTTTAALAESGKHVQGMSLAVIRVVRLVRVFRIFKLSRHSTGLRILGKTLSSSFRELGLLLFFVIIGVVLFSSAVYFAEIDSNMPKGQSSHFKSIPDAFWWAIVTMTTVGYGDMHPITMAGKLVGSACALTGILCLALPVPVIVSNFMYYYQRAVANKKE